ncbi:MAG: thioredoxin family protein [Flavobacteriaceae bacterium]|nr:thioredoxin family protein [Flavobacteriaceae bacterium]
MTKFGELIDVDIPVLINFYQQDKNTDTVLKTLKDISATVGAKAKIIKIDVAKNETLAEALKIKGTITYVIYKGGEMKWRQNGELNAEVLVDVLQEFIQLV